MQEEGRLAVGGDAGLRVDGSSQGQKAGKLELKWSQRDISSLFEDGKLESC